ncbi:MAG: hypothetical protein ACNI27_07095 [Desulfovibrio sp.]
MIKQHEFSVVRKGEAPVKIKGVISNNTAFFESRDADVATGDEIIYHTPAENISYIVVDPNYHPNMGGLKAHYQAKIQRADSITNKPSVPSQVNNYNLSDQARVNVNSTDNSTTTVITNDSAVFEQLASAIKSNVAPDEQKQYLEMVDNLKNAPDKQSYKKAFDTFIQGSTKIIEVISPLIPQLSALF